MKTKKKVKPIRWDFEKAFAEETTPLVISDAEWEMWKWEMNEMPQRPPTDEELDDMARFHDPEPRL